MKRDTLDQATLKKLLHYDPETGIFTWLVRPVLQKQDRSFNTLLAGKRAGVECPRGYRQICILQYVFREHHLAWLYMTGEWPNHDVDHRNTEKNDSRWENLRPATESQNGANTHAQQRNTSGFKGVSWCNFTGRWVAKIKAAGKFYHLGRHDTPEAAHAAYVAAAKLHFGEYARFS